jgi:hypothetical protein
MFVVARVPFDGGVRSRNPTSAHGADGGILGENFRQSVREFAAQCSNVVFGAHGLPPTLEWTCHKANRHCSDGFRERPASN